MSKPADISSYIYSPYSGIKEFCYVQGTSGTYYPGVRVENISYPLTISAMQGAICSCLANGDIPSKFYQPKPVSELLDFWVREFDLQQIESRPQPEEMYQPVKEISGTVIEELDDLCASAVTIHSDFPVSALLETDKGYVPGVNVEVAAWSLGLCAERVAISQALSAGITEFNRIHVYAPKSEFCSPCGACRQVINEFLPDQQVELHHSTTSLTKHFVQHLLPYGFTSGSLKGKD